VALFEKLGIGKVEEESQGQTPGTKTEQENVG